MSLIVFCLICILQIQNISTGFRDTSHSVNFSICKRISDSSATAIGLLLQSLVYSNRKSVKILPINCYHKLQFQDRLMTDLTTFETCTNLKQPYCFIKVHWSIKIFVKLKETQLFYLVIKLRKAVVSAWKNFR